MDNVTNYWNVFVSTGMIDDYMTYKRVEQVNKVDAVEKVNSAQDTRNSNDLFNR